MGRVGEKEEEQRWVYGQSKEASSAGLCACISNFQGSGVGSWRCLYLILCFCKICESKIKILTISRSEFGKMF